jgi:hypothetical protein
LTAIISSSVSRPTSYFEAALARVSRNLVTGTIDEAVSPEGLDLQVVISPAEALSGGVLNRL